MLRRSFLRLLGLAPVAAPMAVAAATAPAVRSFGMSTMAFGEIAFAPGEIGVSEAIARSGMSLPADNLAQLRGAISPEGARFAAAEAFADSGVGNVDVGGFASTDATYLDLYAPEDLDPEGE